VKLCELKPDIMQRFVGELANNRESRLSAKSVCAVFSILSGALQCAVEYGYIMKNPCSKTRLPKITENEVRIFSREEQEKIECAIIHSDDKRTIAVLVCLYTGIRIGELCALKWENISFANNYLNIKQSMTRVKNLGDEQGAKTKIIFEEPKTAKSKRLLPLPDFLVLILKKMKQGSQSDFIFSVDGIKPLQPRTLQFIYKRLLVQADVEYRNFHALRHTFATRAIEFGVDVKTVSEALGHSNSAITINRYTHSLMEQKQNMMQRFDNFYVNKKASFT
jgi:integrase